MHPINVELSDPGSTRGRDMEARDHMPMAAPVMMSLHCHVPRGQLAPEHRLVCRTKNARIPIPYLQLDQYTRTNTL